MRTYFALTLLASSIMLSACSITGAPEVELINQSTIYSDRVIDGLGEQKYAESQMLHMRKIQQLEHELESLEQKRRALESSMGISELEVSSGSLSASDSEAQRLTDFAAATYESQARLAAESANQAINLSRIENERDALLLEAELEAERRLRELDYKYQGSVESAKSEQERARLKSELDIEKAKAEAERRKAQVRADAAGEVSQLESRYQSRIADAKRSAHVAGSAVTAEAQAQRVKMALANADAQRYVKEDIKRIEGELAELRIEQQTKTQPLMLEIASLNERLASLQGQLSGVETLYKGKADALLATLYGVKQKELVLAEVERGLITAPAAPASNPIADGEVIRLEGELAQRKAQVDARLASSIADIEHGLMSELDQIGQNLNRNVAALPSTAHESAAVAARLSAESGIKNELSVKKTQITSEARTQIAEANAKTELGKAGIVAPVMTARAVYSGAYGDQPVAFAARSSQEKQTAVAAAKPQQAPSRSPAVKPVPQPAQKPLVAATFEPVTPGSQRVVRPVDDVVIASGVMAGGGMKPLIVSPAATTYSVVYLYDEKGSADRFMNYLRAYGINDFTYRYSEQLGKHVLFMGKYTSKDQAASKVAQLNKTTSTANAQIIERDIP